MIALFVALGGSAAALSGSNTVFSDDIVNGQVKRVDQARDQQTDWAVVNANGTIAAQSGGISVVAHTATGQYHLQFPVLLGTRPISATIHGGGAVTGQISATRCGAVPAGGASCQGGLDQRHVYVRTTNSAGGSAEMKFIVVVLPK